MEFVTSNGQRVELENCGDCVNAKLYSEDGEYMGEINWDVDTLSDMLFTE